MPAIPQILVVDDESAISELFVDFFEGQDLDMTAVDSGEAAVELLSAQPYKLIFCDLRMPGLCGSPLVQRMHEIVPEAAIVLMTGAPDDDEVDVAMAAGAVETLPKPFPLQRLMEICRTYLAA